MEGRVKKKGDILSLDEGQTKAAFLGEVETVGGASCNEGQAKSNANFYGSWQLLWFGFVYSLTNINCGMSFAFVVSSMGFFTNKTSQAVETGIIMDDHEMSWFVSMMHISLLLGTLLSGFLVDHFGSKWVLRLSNLLFVLGYLAIDQADSVIQILLARFAQGIAGGLSIPASSIVLSDIAIISLRGPFTSSVASTNNLGYLVGLAIGCVGDLRLILIFYSMPSLAFLLLSLRLPESPVWLARKRGKEKAREALESIRGSSCVTVEEELQEVLLCLNTRNQQQPQGPLRDIEVAPPEGANKKSTSYRSKSLLKPLLIGCVLMILHTLCGIDPINVYVLLIFANNGHDGSGTADSFANMTSELSSEMEAMDSSSEPFNYSEEPRTIDPYTLSLIMSFTSTTAYALATLLMMRIPRKKHVTLCGLLLSFSLCVLSLSISGGNGSESGSGGGFLWRHLPAMSAVAVSAAYGGGYGPVGWTIPNEIFAPRFKTFGCSFCYTIRYIALFLLLKCYPFLMGYVGLKKLFLAHSAITLGSVVFAHFFLPETLGLSLHQITHLFKTKRSSTFASTAAPATPLTETPSPTIDTSVFLGQEDQEKTKGNILEPIVAKSIK